MSASSAHNGKGASKPKKTSKTNGTKAQNGVKIQSRMKSKAQSEETADTSFENMDPETLDDLVNELFDKKKHLTVSQKQQKKKLQSYMMAQLEGSSSASDDDDDDDDDDEEDSNSNEAESGSESDAISADDSLSSDDENHDDSGDDDGSGSDDSYDDDSDDDDSHSTEDLTEYTINTSSLDQSSAEPTPPKRQKSGEKRRSPTQDEESEDGNNNNKSSARKLKKKEESAINNRIQQRKSMVAPTTTTKPSSCPLTRKSCTANGSAAKSCPLPTKNQKQSAVSGAAKSCPLPPKGEKSSSSGKAAKSCPLPPKEKKSSSGAAAKSCPLPPKNEKPSSSGASCALPSKASKQVQPRVCQLSDKPKSSSSQSTQKRAKNEAAEGAVDTNGRQEAHHQNSIEEGKRILSWVLNPIKPDDFFKDFWEKNACQVQRNAPTYFSELISFEMIDQMMLKHHLEFTTNIDVTSYKDGRRETLNPEGRAMPPTVWGFYGEGCSIRILNPSTYLPGLRTMCSLMQEFFHCLVGANVYLTPPNSQGFAPHFDDIEAFVLQVEGRKRWRLYMPLQPSDVLARESSGNYTPDQLGEPIFDEVLKPGDVLYFPRGTVHQAITEKKHHSLHITLSVYQQQAYANLLEKLMPMVLQSAIRHSVSLRRGLPLHTWQHLGIAHGATKSSSRSHLIKSIQEMVQQHLTPTENQIDAAVDQLAKRYQHEALPPTILPEEKLRTVFGSHSATDAHGKCLCDYELTEETSIRLLRANILRLVVDETHLRVYYYVDNAMEYCKYDANFMEIEPTEAAAVETLMHAYPAYVKISMLPLRTAERRVEVATALWERGLLMTETPFK